MKKIILYFWALLAMAPAACTLESDDSGDLAGQWHMERVDTLATEGLLDLGQQKLYWCFQGRILETSTRDGAFHQQVLFHYEQVDKQLNLSQPRLSNRDEGDPQLDTTHEFSRYGINELKESFTIEELDGHHLVLRSKTLRLYLRHF